MPYDVMNHMVLESNCCRCKFDEMSLAEDIISDAEAEMDAKESHRKHKMMVNRTLGIGILKKNLSIYYWKRTGCYGRCK